MSGMYPKYIVKKSSGYTESHAKFFVFRVDEDEYARDALELYAELISDDNPELAKDIMEMLNDYTATVD